MTDEEHTVKVTDGDLQFLERVLEHYRLFAGTAERQGEKKTAGVFRKQEFHAERMLERLQAQTEETREQKLEALVRDVLDNYDISPNGLRWIRKARRLVGREAAPTGEFPFGRPLTGKELRFAAEHHVPVRYVERPFDPSDEGYDGVTALIPANVGYYIGPSDIDPEEWDDEEKVEAVTDTCEFGVYAKPGEVYSR